MGPQEIRKMTEAGAMVLPGERLGAAEEFAPGKGTYEYKGEIFASLMGKVQLHPAERTVSVLAIHEIPHLAEGDEVYARVDEIKSAMLVVTVLCSASTGRLAPGYPEGTVHISKAKDSYVDRLDRDFAEGDVIRAKIIQGYPSIKLSTQGESLGVVSARCQDCHSFLTKLESNKLVCTRCGKREERHASKDYGKNVSYHTPTA